MSYKTMFSNKKNLEIKVKDKSPRNKVSPSPSKEITEKDVNDVQMLYNSVLDSSKISVKIESPPP